MKSSYKKSFFSVLLAVAFNLTLTAQDLDRKTVQQLLENKSFVFKAQSASPMGSSIRQLTSEYDVRFLGDSIVSYLPYFGRAYTAPLPGESGIKFTTTSFDYKAKARKKGGWEISIVPENAGDVRQLFLSISDKGYATLQVTSTNRQPISFSGYITARK